MVKKKSTVLILVKELFRTLVKEWKQLFSIIAISFLSICLFSGLTSNAKNFKSRIDYLYEKTNFAEIYVNTSSGDSNDKIYIDTLLKEGETSETRINLTAEDSYATVNLLVAKDDSILSTPIVTSGEKGFLVMNKYAETHKLKIGDPIKLKITNYFLLGYGNIINLLDGMVKEGKANVLKNSDITLSFNMTGTMYHPEGVQNSTFSASVVYTNPQSVKKALTEILEENFDVDALQEALPLLTLLYPTVHIRTIDELMDTLLEKLNNQILINCYDKKTVLNAINEYYQHKSKNNLILASQKESLPYYLSVNEDAKQAEQLTFVFPLIFFLVSVLVIMTTLSQMIIKQRNQIGCLKAIGVKRTDIYLHYMFYGAVLCFIGGILGFFLGPVIIPPVLGIKYNLLWDLPKKAISFLHIASFSIFIAMVAIAMLCSFLVSHLVIKEKPVDTLRPKAPKVQKKVANSDNPIYRKVPLTARMSLRNIWRNKAKSIMVMIGTMGCTALLVCGFGIMDTLDHCIAVDYGGNTKVELVASPSDKNEENRQFLMEIEGVKKVEETFTYPVTISKDSYVVTSLTLLEEDSTYFTLSYGKGGLTIDQSTAKNIGVKEGDFLRLAINGQVQEKRVDTIFRSSLLHGIYDLSSNYQDDIKLIPTYYVFVEKGYQSSPIRNTIKANETFSTVMTMKDIKSKADEILSSVLLMTNVVKIFAVLLAVVVIYNLTSLNISERNRDIATMKVLGFSFWEISKTLTGEIVIDTIIGSCLGLTLGYPMTVLVMMVNKTELLTYLYHVGWLSFAVSFLISVVSAFVVSLLLNIKCRKIKMVESLKSIE